MKIERLQKSKILESLKTYPIVAILGARQVGKTTLAKEISLLFGKKSIYLDLENPSDIAKLNDPLLFFADNEDKMVILDEIQHKPELFSLLRSIVDKDRRNGRFLILGSASPDLLNKSSQTLAGRIRYHELSPFCIFETGFEKLDNLWIKGGFPSAFMLKNSDKSFDWIESFVKTFLERDLNVLGFNLSPTNMRKVWMMTAHYHSSTVNYSNIAKSLEVTHKTIKRWIDILSDTYMLRQLQPWEGNVAKRLIKSPKIYLRDSGILHYLLGIESKDKLLSNPMLGASWEGFVVEQIAAVIPERSNMYFYRTVTGDEIDLIVDSPKYGKIAFEIKRSLIPSLGKGFYNALEVIKPNNAYVIYSGKEKYRLNQDITAIPLQKVREIFKSDLKLGKSKF